jgi:hypothetical protein
MVNFMATKKPRLTVTLDPETYQAFKLFSEAQGRSMGSSINEVLTEVSPAVNRVTAFLLRAQSMNDSFIESLASDLEEAAFGVDDIHQSHLQSIEALIGWTAGIK